MHNNNDSSTGDVDLPDESAYLPTYPSPSPKSVTGTGSPALIPGTDTPETEGRESEAPEPGGAESEIPESDILESALPESAASASADTESAAAESETPGHAVAEDAGPAESAAFATVEESAATIIGNVDGVMDGAVHGWLLDMRDLSERIVVELCANGVTVTTFVADILREDLAGAGYTDARHGFNIPLPVTVRDGQSREFTVVVARDGIRLADWQMAYAEPVAEAALLPESMPESVPELVPESQPEPSSVVGNVDGIMDGAVHGWVLDTADLTDRLAVELRADDTPVAGFVANILREDLLAAGYADGAHGFNMPVPDAVRDGQPHDLTVILVRTGRALADWRVTFVESPPPAPESVFPESALPESALPESALPESAVPAPASETVIGHVDGIMDGAVHGWVLDTTDRTERIAVELRSDDVVVAVFVADIPRDDLLAAGHADGAHGFNIPLPDAVRDGQAHALTVVVVSSGEPLAAWQAIYVEPVADDTGPEPDLMPQAPPESVQAQDAVPEIAPKPAGDIIGNVDGVLDGAVHGWVLDRSDLGERIELELRSAGDTVASGVADVLRDDLAAAGFADTAHGFMIPLPRSLRDGGTYDLTLVVARTGEALAGWRVSYTDPTQYDTIVPAFVATTDGVAQVWAAIDGVSDDTVLGWLLNPGDLGERLSVDLMSGEDVVATATADQMRDDLAAAGHSDARHGFALVIPDRIKDGYTHILQVVDSRTRTPLANWTHSYTRELPAPAALPSPILGYFEGIKDRRVLGWAFDPRRPDQPVELYIVVDGVPKSMILADRHRPDVAGAGHGNGNSGFDHDVPDTIFDGVEHIVEIAIAETGGRLPGDKARIRVGVEGVAFLDRKSAAIDGWARNASNVVIKFDDNSQVIVQTGRPVPGFTHDKLGFRASIPAHLLDNAWHSARVFYLNNNIQLDGSPIAFRLAMPETTLEYIEMSGRRVFGRIYDVRDPSTPVTLSVEVDGVTFATIKSDRWRATRPPVLDERLAQEFSFLLPAHARTFALRRLDGRDRGVLATWAVTPCLEREPSQPDVSCELSPASLENPEISQGVAAAFARFQASPGDDFDAQWYLLTYPEVAGDIAAGAVASPLDHYVTRGARAGYSPSGLFDEAYLRTALPILADSIASGSIHSAFALYLHLGKGDAFDPVGGLSSRNYVVNHPQTAHANPLLHLRQQGLGALAPDSRTAYDGGAPEPEIRLLPSNLPRRLAERDPATSVYAAWMARIDPEPDLRAQLTAEEAAARQFVGNAVIARAPLISIIMPTFNRSYTIAEAIQSVLDQSYTNWELLICDDSSTDKTPLVVAQFKDPRIRYMQFEKSNGAATRNKGLRFANGDYIAYLDSDNMWDPLFLDVMIRTLLSNPGQSMAYSGYIDTEIHGAAVKLEKLALPVFDAIKLSSRNFIDLNTIVHHRRLYDWLGGFDEKLERLQDWDMALRYTSIFNPVFAPWCLVYYRRNIAWGQVTHLFIDANVQSTVAEKTAHRLDTAHVRLQVCWPSRPRLTLIVQGSAGHVRAARSFARLAAPFADVSLLCPEGVDASGQEGIDVWHLSPAMFRNVERLNYILSILPRTAAIISFGCDAGYLRQLMAGALAPFFQAVSRSDGLYLDKLGRSNCIFHIGALPLSVAATRSDGGLTLDTPGAILGTLFPLRPEGKLSLEDFAQQAAASQFAFLIAPHDPFEGRWHITRNGVIEPFTEDTDLAVAIARDVSKFVIAGTPLGELSLGAQSLLFDRMAAGRTTILCRDPYGTQLIEAGAAYGIEVRDYTWLIDKLPKLFRSDTTLEKLTRSAERSYAIRMHPELVQERIVNFVHQLAFSGEPEEVVHVA